MRFLFILCLIVSFINCISIDEKPAESELAGKYHRVKKGDTLSLLAQKYRSSAEEIMDVNGVDSEKSLRVGQELFIPDPDPIGTRIIKHASKKVVKAAAPQAKKMGGKTPRQALATKPKKTIISADQKIFDFPVPGGNIFKTFSANKQKPYDGIAIRAKRGSPVIASLDGKVIFVGDDGTRFGLLVIIEHKDPYISVYTHLDKALVKAGTIVNKRHPIGTVGISGGVATPRLHFQIRVSERPKDPQLFLRPH
jgi:murein DD-endopeptidase MepM/ murein hydrolase activator NlpD